VQYNIEESPTQSISWLLVSTLFYLSDSIGFRIGSPSIRSDPIEAIGWKSLIRSDPNPIRYDPIRCHSYLELGFLEYSPLLLFSFNSNSILNFFIRIRLWSSTAASDHYHHHCKKKLKSIYQHEKNIKNSVCKRAACKTVRMWDLCFNLNRELRHEKALPNM